MLRKSGIIFFVVLFFSTVSATNIKVGLEPFPPFIIDKNTGYTIDLLREIEAISDLQFDIYIMSYVRAKRDLKSNNIDMIAHTPYQVETKEFYDYAQELDYSIVTISDLYVTNKASLNDISKLTIGVPRGNEDFLSELLDLPIKNFYLGNLNNLLRMLKAGRIDAFWFERASTMLTLQKLKIDNVFYMKSPENQISAGFAVRNDSKGTALMKKLNALIEKIDKDSVLEEYNKYLSLPTKGVFNLESVDSYITNGKLNTDPNY